MSRASQGEHPGMMATMARFEKVWTALELRGDPAPWFDRLMAGYGEAGRAYHNTQHLHECLVGLDATGHLVESAPAVEFALWFHDVVYDTRASDNEERSASLAVECLRHAGVAGVELAPKVHELVMLTKTHHAGADPDGAVMVDVDLAILGHPWSRFEEYDAAIRREYGWVPEDVYTRKRAEVLRRFLNRDFIYSTRFFRESHEQGARENLSKKLMLMEQGGGR